MSVNEEKEGGLVKCSPPTSPIADHSDATERNEKNSISSSQKSIPAAVSVPEGGYGWVCTIACALINMHTWGMNSAYGVFLAYYLSSNTFPGATRIQFAFIGGLSISTALLISPIATTSVRIFGTKISLFIGILFETASFFAASFASQIWHLFLTQGVCFGIGLGFLFTASVGIVAQWFDKKRSLATGIASAGSGFGGLAYSLAAQSAIAHLGLPWAFRILGIVAFVVNTICAILLKDRNKAVGARHVAFDVKLLKRPEFLTLLAFGSFSMLAYVVLVFSLANYAASIGLTAHQGSVVGAVLNLGQGLGRAPIGYFSDTMGRMNTAAFMTLLSGVLALAIWVNTHTYGLLIFYSLIGGTVAGTYWTVVAPVTAEVVGLADLPSALSITWVALTVSTLFSEPIGLQIVAINGGNYLRAQLFCGFMYVGAAVCVWLVRAWKIGQLEALTKEVHTSKKELAVGEIGEPQNRPRRKDARDIKSPFVTRFFRWQIV